MSKIIKFGITREYLSHWTVQDALREVYQNFIDYGYYTEEYTEEYLGVNCEDNIKVSINNDFNPKDYSFLGIGNSIKNNVESIGKYGEGLKMAMLIFLRENISCKIFVKDEVIIPIWSKQYELPETFALKINKSFEDNILFKIEIILNKNIFLEFHNNIIREEDKIFTYSYYGDIVNKEPGNIYCGNLFVTKVKNLKYAYNFKPSVLSLDRDRKTPSSFDINYNSSKIQENYGKFTPTDSTYNDFEYISRIPSDTVKYFKPRLIDKNIEFVYKDKDNNYKILKNDSIKETLKKDSRFQRIINKIRSYIATKLGLYELLIEFQNKHVYTSEAKKDFQIILNRVKPN